MIYNKTFEIKKCKGGLILDHVLEFFSKNLEKNQKVIRWAIVGVKNKKFVIEASIMEE